MGRADEIADINVRVWQKLLGRLRLADAPIFVAQTRRAALLLEKCEVELVTLLRGNGRCGAARQLLPVIGLHNGRLVQDLLVLAQE